MLGDIARYEGDLVDAAAEYGGGLVAARTAGHASYTVWALAGLGQVALWRGEFGRAAELFREALGRYRELGNARSVGFVLYMLGLTALKAGEIDRADALLSEALAPRWQLGGRVSTADTLDWLAVIACGRGQLERAVRLHAAADGARSAVGAMSPPIERDTVDAAMRRARGALGDRAFLAAWGRGAALPLDQAVAEALDRGCAGRSASPPAAAAADPEHRALATPGQQGVGADPPRLPGDELGAARPEG